MNRLSSSLVGVLLASPAGALFALLPALALAAPHPGSAQEIRGLVAEQGSLDPVSEAVVTLFRVTEGTGDLIPAASVPSAGDGSFTLRADAPGRYRVQAIHRDLSSPLSADLTLDRNARVDDLALLVPSRLPGTALGCPEGHGEDGSVVVGVVRDGLSGIPLSGARVVARWMDGEGGGEREARADGAGLYRLCGIPSAGFVRIRGEFLGQEGEWTQVEVRRPARISRDVEVTAGTAAATRPGAEPTREGIPMESAAHALADLRGELVDAESGRPLSQASVRLGRGGQLRITDGSGRFAFQGIQPGRHLLEIAHRGFVVRSDEVEVPGGRGVLLRLRVSPQAVELEGIQVEARGAQALGGPQRARPPLPTSR